MNKTILNSTKFLLSMSAFLLTGCGDGRQALVPVSGRVLIDGQPLKYGVVRFIPENGRPSGGKLDDNGKFALTCYDEADGVAPGRSLVEVLGGETLSSTQVRWHAPKKYTSYGTSGLEQKIDEPTDSVVLNISWGGGAPFVETIATESK
jgi:hypothetical protein